MPNERNNGDRASLALSHRHRTYIRCRVFALELVTILVNTRGILQVTVRSDRYPIHRHGSRSSTFVIL